MIPKTRAVTKTCGVDSDGGAGTERRRELPAARIVSCDGVKTVTGKCIVEKIRKVKVSIDP